MKVKKISVANVEVSSLPKLLDEEKIGFQPINQVNWTEYPYCPKVEFRVAHTESAILLHFKVTEASVRARYGEDNGSVWTDSCVEFFSIPAGDGIYYNIECNCIGTVLGREIDSASSGQCFGVIRESEGYQWIIASRESPLLSVMDRITG